MIDPNQIPNWIRAKALVDCLMNQVKGMSKKEGEEMLANLKNGQAFRVDTCLPALNDEVRFYFALTNDEDEPEFLQSIGHFTDTEDEDHLNVFNGIPKNVLAEMIEKNDEKQLGLLGYIDMISMVLIWQCILLLDEKYELHKDTDTSKQDVNLPFLFSAYAGQMCAILDAYDLFDIWLEKAEQGRDQVIDMMEEAFGITEFALEAMLNCIKSLTDENYEKFVLYCKAQKLVKAYIEKEEE